jgi:hypothetical protein
MDNRIRKLLQECAVRISVAASRGTGFFAASPGLVVTCAHVVNRRTCWPPLADLCGVAAYGSRAPAPRSAAMANHASTRTTQPLRSPARRIKPR